MLILYFFVGGITVALTAYFGTHGKGLLAAFAGLFPGITLVSAIAIYTSCGQATTVSYARGLLVLLPAWLLYVAGIIFLTPRIGLPALALSALAYMAIAFLIVKLTS